MKFGEGRMESLGRIRNVGGGEAIFRWVAGILFILSAYFVSGGFRWVLGFVGVALILTTIVGY